MPIEMRTEQIIVRVRPSEAEKLRERAEADGERVSTWIRQVALREVRKLEAANA